MPTHAECAAGMDGVVDNTVRFSPCKPRYGKTREYHAHEIKPNQRVLAADTLAATHGKLNFPSLSVDESMPAILPKYSSGVPHEAPDGPMKLSYGFVCSPNAQRSKSYIDDHAASRKLAPTFAVGVSPSASPDSTMSKFSADLTASSPQIPVIKAYFVG